MEQLSLHPGGVRGPSLPPGLPGGGVLGQPDSPDVTLAFTGGGIRGHPGALPGLLLHGPLGRGGQDWLGLHETKEQIVWFVKFVFVILLLCSL